MTRASLMPRPARPVRVAAARFSRYLSASMRSRMLWAVALPASLDADDGPDATSRMVDSSPSVEVVVDVCDVWFDVVNVGWSLVADA